MAVETEARLDCSNRAAASIDHAEPERFTSLCAAGNALRALSPWILGFTELRTLDLCHNLLCTCAGIEACRRLAVLDLRGNLLADGATLGDLREAVSKLEELARTARRVLGGAHPEVVGIDQSLRRARAALSARETPPSPPARGV